jgi:pSer/pThr/pTyr-binding forkhead associated (FHA) protein
MPFFLTPFWGGANSPRYPVSGVAITVGRSERAQIVLREPSVSREHARLSVREGEVWIEDLRSKHGTFVNSRRISDPTHLEPGDILVFGLVVVMRLELAHEEEESATVPPARRQTSRGEVAVTATGPGNPIVDPLQRLPTSAATAWSDLSQTKALPPGFDPAHLGRLAVSLLPTHYATLTLIVDQLKRTVAQRDTPLDAGGLLGLAQRMLDSVTNLMIAAVQPGHQAPQTLEVVEILRRAAAKAAPELAHRQIKVEIDAPAGMLVMLPGEAVVSALAGLLANSAQVCLDGSLIAIEGRSSDRGIELRIEDQGYGYPDDVVELARKPAGYETDPLVARLREAWALVRAHGGSLSVTTRPGFGSVVEILFPAYEAEAFSSEG